MAKGTPRRFAGLAASPGVARGPAFLFVPARPAGAGTAAPPRLDPVAEGERLHRAVEAASAELRGLVPTVDRDTAGILEAHLLMLDDPMLVGQARDLVLTGIWSAEAALAEATQTVRRTLLALDSPLLRARAADVEDVAGRMERHLRGDPAVALNCAGAVVVAADLLPSDLLALARAGAVGFALAGGSPTAHVAIITRSLGLPLVCGVEGLLEAVAPGVPLAVDGGDGSVIVDPAGEWRARPRAAAAVAKPTQGEVRTADGRRVQVFANAGRFEDVAAALADGAEGVGMLRTEFLYLTHAPGEEEQFALYRHMVEALGGRPLVVRTLDAGGDKPLPYLDMPPEPNPFLGRRGLRFTLAHPDLLRVQLRAILRAGAFGAVRLMHPMVTEPGELVAARGLLAEAKAELAARGETYAEEIEVGAMVEVPAAALCAGALAREAAFFSVGTNDLAQYVLAVDRTNPAVARLYDQLHPAVLRLLQLVVRAAQARGIPVAVCGEAAGDLAALPLLVGLGVAELSVAPGRVAAVRAAIPTLLYAEARDLAAARLAD